MYDEPIAALDYRQFCDHVYEGKGSIPSGIVYCSTEHISQFFKTHGKNNNSYTIVSACCDYSVCEQAEYPVINDFWNSLPLADLSNYDGYSSILLPARCNLDKCKISDKFSVKCYSFTHSTFPEIPPNIKKWFLVNKNFNHPIVEFLPLGLYFEGAVETLKEVLTDLPSKTELCYANWTDYTVERVQLKQDLPSHPWIHLDLGRRPFKEFLLNMARYKYVMCPEGNGLDCHRIWEALYLGCLPVMKATNFAKMLLAEEFPITLVDSWQELTEDFLIKDYNKAKRINTSKLYLNYWRAKILGTKLPR